ncbi:MAG: hypothetical protein ACK52P_23510 [Alphaproteobacteria bacterium]|jgi:hypothetical protein
MKAGLIDRIRSVGHWRVVMRPLRPLEKNLSLQRCFDEVERARVSLRGWDYPHIARQNDETGGIERVGDYIENWCDWRSQIEFWRMYRSGQFLSYCALDDDMKEVEIGGAAGKFLNVVGAIYSIGEFVEFANRLVRGGLYKDGLHISVTLKGTENRRLAAGSGRMPFFDSRTTRVAAIVVERRLDRAAIDEGAVSVGLGIILEIFDHFGWNPEHNKLRTDLEFFYRRE